MKAIITEIDTQDLANIIENLSTGDLSHDAAYELAYFIGDVWSDGITFDLLRRIATESSEYDDFQDLLHDYFDEEDPYAWIRNEEEDEDLTDEECEEKLIERMQDDQGLTILRAGKHWVVID